LSPQFSPTAAPIIAFNVPHRVLGLPEEVFGLCGAGGLHFCAQSETDIVCWGTCTHGECLNNNADVAFVPEEAVLMQGLDLLDLMCSFEQTCVRLSNGTDLCTGELFNEETGERDHTALDFENEAYLEPLSSISSAQYEVCGIDNGGVFCLGTRGFGTGNIALPAEAVSACMLSWPQWVCALVGATVQCIDTHEVNEPVIFDFAVDTGTALFCGVSEFAVLTSATTLSFYSPVAAAGFATFEANVDRLTWDEYGVVVFTGSEMYVAPEAGDEFEFVDNATLFRAGGCVVLVAAPKLLSCPETTAYATEITFRAPIQKLAVSLFHVCVLLNDGTLQCAGDETNFADFGAALVLDVVVSSLATCVLDAYRKVWCAGSQGVIIDVEGVAGWTVIPNLVQVRRLLSSVSSMCAITVWGEVWCWGTRDTFVLEGLQPLRMNYTAD
jgi:hypothetical protein